MGDGRKPRCLETLQDTASIASCGGLSLKFDEFCEIFVLRQVSLACALSMKGTRGRSCRA